MKLENLQIMLLVLLWVFCVPSFNHILAPKDPKCFTMLLNFFVNLLVSNVLVFPMFNLLHSVDEWMEMPMSSQFVHVCEAINLKIQELVFIHVIEDFQCLFHLLKRESFPEE